MESLYRKYRPLTFDSVVGQQHIVSTLEHAITEGRLSHAYLFCGPRGTGKTTMARILAKALLCQKADEARAAGASGCMPDGTCEECELIAEGNHPDVYELDAASRTGVDNVREEIINSVNFAPVRGKYKIYIIDEVHMLTAAAFNALLKTLEEPPAHVVFVLCTTDPQKILETILSRCQRFDFHRISNEDIEGRLRYVCEQEGFDYDDEAIEIVARHARGGMRDALSTLEQLSVFGAGSVHADDARSLLGEVANSVLAEFVRAIAARDVTTLFGLVRGQVDEGNDLLELTRDLVAHVRDVYMVRVAGPVADLFECGPEELAALEDEAKAFESADRLARLLTVLDDAALEMRNAPDTRLVLEIALTRLARPEADLTLDALAERLDRLEAMVANGAVPARVAAASAAPAPASSNAAARKAPASAGPAAPGALPWDRGASTVSAPATVQPVVANPPSAHPVVATAPVAEPAPQPEPAAKSEPQPTVQPAAASAVPERSATAESAGAVVASDAAAVTDAGDLQRKWTEVVQRVTRTQASRGALLQSSRAQADDGSTITVGFPKGSNFAIKMLGRADSQQVVLPIVCAVFGQRELVYVMDGGAPAAPRQEEHSPAARVAESADPQPVPQAAPAPSKQEETHPDQVMGEPKAAPAGAPSDSTHLSGEKLASAPASAPTAVVPPASHPVTAPASRPSPAHARPASPQTPAAKTRPQVANASLPPWERSDNPAGAPATGKLPTEPAPRAPERPWSKPDRATGTSPASPAPWESDQVPYGDADVVAAGSGDDLPPFDVADTPAKPSGSATVSAEPSTPWATEAGGAASFSHQGAAPHIPQTEQEAKDLLREVFGDGVIFKPVDE